MGDVAMAHHVQAPWYLRRNLTPIGQLLVEYMRDHGIATQQELAAHIGIKQQSLSEYLAPNGRIPRPRALQRIAHATGIPLITVYEAAGIPLYNGLGSVPAPAPAEEPPPAHTPPDMWSEFYNHLGRLHLEGKITQEVYEGLINEAEDVRRGYDPMQRFIVGEFVDSQPTPPPVVPVAPSAEMPTPLDEHAQAESAE
jgi:transcriptional regulator with XRE-family HTH domain